MTVLIQTAVGGLLAGSVYALVAIGFNLILGVMDLVFFSHGHMVMVGMYLTYLLFTYFHLDPILSALITMPVMFGVGQVLYRTLLHNIQPKPHSTHIVYTLGILLFLENLANFIFGGDARSVTTWYTTASLAIGNIRISVPQLLAGVIALVTTLLLHLFLQHTDQGKAIRAATDNRLGANLVGINVRRVHTVAFGVGIAVSSLAGAAMMPFALVSPFTGMELVLRSFIIVVIGGLGSLPGALLGGVLMGVVESVLGVFISTRLALALTFVLVMVLIVVKPTGLMGRA